MSTPSHETRLRSALNAYVRAHGMAAAMSFAIKEAGGLMGTKDAADVLGTKGPNIGPGRSVPIEPIARISGGTIPVYLGVVVHEKAQERRARRAWASE